MAKSLPFEPSLTWKNQKRDPSNVEGDPHAESLSRQGVISLRVEYHLKFTLRGHDWSLGVKPVIAAFLSTLVPRCSSVERILF